MSHFLGVFAVTAMDSVTKALEFLGLHQEEQTDAESPFVSPNSNLNRVFDSSFSLNQYLKLQSVIFSNLYSNFLFFAGFGSKLDHHRLFYAWNDRL